MLKNGHVLCYSDLEDRRELAVEFLVNKNIAGNLNEHYSIEESLSGFVLSLNKRYKFKVIKGYAPASSHDERFYEDVESALAKIKTHYTVLIGYFNAQVGKEQAGD